MLVPGGQLLLAFQVGDERRHIQQAYGHAVSLDAYRMQPDQLAQQLHAAGLPVHARVLRDPDDRRPCRRRTCWPASARPPTPDCQSAVRGVGATRGLGIVC